MRTSSTFLLLAGLLLAVAGCGAPGGGDATTSGERLVTDTGEGPLPAATFATLADPDVTVATADWQGTPTVVNFWATWCGFCLEEMPDLQAASERLDGEVRFVGIDRQDQRDAALAFVEETGVTYDQLSSPEGEFFTEVRARGMPTTLFVDGEGQVRFRHTGPLDTATVLALVEEHLGVSA